MVTAVYRPGDTLDRLLASLDRLTLPSEQLELVLVDDGSPDDETWPRLQALAEDRPNVVAHRIEHSGWPSRPRNVGIGLARGRYVQFVDQDDELLPDGLRRALAYAEQHDLDICGVKEIETGTPAYNIASFRSDRAGERGELGLAELVPMVPHKLYRRRMLTRHEVRFPEGARAIWEDIYFNVDAYVAAERIGTFTGCAVYRHVITGANSSLSYVPHSEEYWRTVGEVMEHEVRVLGTPELARDRRWVLTHQYADRVLRRLEILVTSGHEDRMAAVRGHALAIRERFGEHLDLDQLSVRDRRLDELLSTGADAELVALARGLAALVGTSRLLDVSWDGPTLRISALGTWAAGDTDVALPPAGDADLERVLALLVLRERASEESVLVEPDVHVRMGDAHDPVRSLELDLEAGIDPRTVPPGTYDVFSRNAAFGFVNVRRVRAAQLPAEVALIDGVAVVLYAAKGGTLALDIGQAARSVVNSAQVAVVEALASPRGDGGWTVSVPLGGVRVHGRTELTGRALADGLAPVPARVIGDERGARLELDVESGRGRHRLTLEFAGRQVPSRLVLHGATRWRGPRLSLR